MFFRKKDPSQLRLSEIESYLRNKFSDKIKSEEDRMLGLASSAYSKFDDLRKVLEEMEKKKAQKTFTESVKNSYCDRSLGAIDGLKEPNISNVTAFIQMSKIVSKAIAEINLKEFRHLQEFKTEMSRISQLTKTIKKEVDDLESSYESSISRKIEQIGSMISEISQSRKTFDDMESMLRDTGTTLARTKKESEDYKKRLESLMSDSNNSNLSELRRIEGQISVLKQKILNDLSGLDKIFKKMRHELRESKDFDYDNVFEAFVKGEMELKNLTEKTLEAINNHRITFEAKLKEKIHYVLKNFDEIYEMKEEYIDLIDSEEALKRSVKEKSEPIENERKKIKNELEEKNKEIIDLEKKRDSRMNERKKMDEKVQKIADEIQKKLREMLERDIIVEM
ncbi:MAG: hypothetical protein HY513_03405 [Candidatus Aenigmarchaeota archaeon]|nr:hypothetical protein [Candidatus Aenigmarchaeota archaeon]